MIHMALSKSATYFFFLHLYFSFFSRASHGWRKWTIQVIPVCKTNIFCPVLTEHVWQTASLESCSSSESVSTENRLYQPDKERKQGAVVSPSQELMASHSQLLVLDPLLGSSSHTSMATVSFRCLGSFARCGFSVRVCQTSTWKREEEEEEEEEWESLLTVETLGASLHKVWTGCYAWVNTAQMQEDGRALLTACEDWRLFYVSV